MSKQLALSAALSVLAMAGFALFGAPSTTAPQADGATTSYVQAAAPSLD